MTNASSIRSARPPDGSATKAGRVHSVVTLGTGDGPGVRFVIYLHGCPLRCADCADDECRGIAGGELCSADALVERISKFASYMHLSRGGITVAGAEPLGQAAFVRALFQGCRDLGIATALDTSGAGNPFAAKGLLHLTDLVVLDITGYDRAMLGNPSDPRLGFVRMVVRAGVPMWLRLALVPGWNDDPVQIDALADFAQTLPNLERIEVVPFHRLGAIEMSGRCPEPAIRHAIPPTGRQVRSVRNIFGSRGLRTD